MAKETFFRGKNVLITGGLGFIGSNLAIRLCELGAKVTILDSLIHDFGGNRFNIDPIKKIVRVKIADMRDLPTVYQLVRNKSLIFNLAGTLSHIDSMVNPFGDLDINCRAQLCLLEACRKYNKDTRIIFSGTRNQYGKALYLPVDEKHIENPTDINGINSIAGEKYHFLYSRIYGFEVVSLRMSNTFGPRHQMKHSKQGVLNWFIRILMDGNIVKLYGGGLQIRDVNYVDDVVDALICVAKSKKASGNVYNLGGNPITLLQFVEIIIERLGRGKCSFVEFPKDRKQIEIGNYVADISKIKEIGWQPKTQTSEAIAKTIDFFTKYQKYYW